MEEQTFLKRFSEVQNTLKVQKGRVNKFGGYKYRSCEDILKAAKPLLSENNLVLTLTDEIVEICGRYYVQATAKVMDVAGDGCIASAACAREQEVKKGMDESQITGTASSYARKYALNGLFCLDDVQDADDDLYQCGESGLRCERCGNEIKAFRAAVPGGVNYSAEAVAKMTRERFHSQLCWDCAAKVKAERKGSK